MVLFKIMFLTFFYKYKNALIIFITKNSCVHLITININISITTFLPFG